MEDWLILSLNKHKKLLYYLFLVNPNKIINWFNIIKNILQNYSQENKLCDQIKNKYIYDLFVQFICSINFKYYITIKNYKLYFLKNY